MFSGCGQRCHFWLFSEPPYKLVVCPPVCVCRSSCAHCTVHNTVFEYPLRRLSTWLARGPTGRHASIGRWHRNDYDVIKSRRRTDGDVSNRWLEGLWGGAELWSTAWGREHGPSISQHQKHGRALLCLLLSEFYFSRVVKVNQDTSSSWMMVRSELSSNVVVMAQRKYIICHIWYY